MRPTRQAALLAVVIAALYGRTLWFGLMWDDFAALRPRSAATLAATWTGPWDPDGVWPRFYRPLSIALYDGLYRLFGHHDVALHVITLVTLWLAAWLLARVIDREAGSTRLGFIAALLFVTHPDTPASLAVWVSQMFHLTAVLCVLLAMHVWRRGRATGVTGWCLVLAVLSFGVLVKEDVVVVGPALVVWQWLRARTLGDTPPPRRSVVALVFSWAVIYTTVRIAALGLFTGYIPPSLGRFALNGLSAWGFAFAYQWTPSAHVAGVVTGAGLAGLVWLTRRAWPRATRHSRLLVGYGFSLGLFVSLPLVIVSGHTRVHLMIIAAAIAAAGALGAVLDDPRSRARLTSRLGLLAIGLWLLAVVGANLRHTRTYAPCEPESIRRDQEVLLWTIISPDDRALIENRLTQCQIR